MTDELEVGILTPGALAPRSAGRVFLDLLLSQAPTLIPDRYDTDEPVRRRFRPGNLDDILDCWGDGFLWRRSRPKVEGSVFAGNQNLHDTVHLAVGDPGLTLFSVGELCAFLGGLDAAFTIDLAYAHFVGPDEIKDRALYAATVMPFSQGLATRDLRKGLPSLCWAMYFGPPYVSLFGRQTLLTAPVHLAVGLGQGVFLQLSQLPTDVVTDFWSFSETRRRTMGHLGLDAFSQPGRSAERLPEFALG